MCSIGYSIFWVSEMMQSVVSPAVVGAVVVGISWGLQGFKLLCMKGAERGRMGKGSESVVYW